MHTGKKIKIDLKSHLTGEVLFSFEKENNTIKDTVEEAVRRLALLTCVDLKGSDLQGSHLRLANLIGADLSNANLRNVNLQYADLSEANLTNTDLSCADLRGTNCEHAIFKGAKCENTNFNHANLQHVINAPYIPMACPEKGEFVGWKRAKCSFHDGEYIVKLLIPADAKRSSATTNKCRCSNAKVLKIYEIWTGKEVNMVINSNYNRTIYKVGEYVYPDYFDDDRWYECSHGIHFFMTEEEALDYYA